KYLDRTHDPAQAEKAIKFSQDIGFNNLTIDLIYGIPTSTKMMWEQNLEKFFSFRIPHLSAYSLTVEQKTILYHQIKKQKLSSPEENKSIEQFKILLEKSRENNFINYEISNFAKEGYFSKHNSNYWLGENYLGLGPSAHSFNGISRQWNISNITKYIELKNNKNIIAEKEILTKNQQYNEYILTSLRTIWGCDSEHIKNVFGKKYHEFFIKSSQKFIAENKIIKNENNFVLSEEGKLFADGIAAEMFFV
ncbi:MAG: coproporphyrinogen III oxidase, partial [Bacteroidales bacterium]|nr:coproporphyrinogen III oxidase [Bacteroidales bacterium]